MHTEILLILFTLHYLDSPKARCCLDFKHKSYIPYYTLHITHYTLHITWGAHSFNKNKGTKIHYCFVLYVYYCSIYRL